MLGVKYDENVDARQAAIVEKLKNWEDPFPTFDYWFDIAFCAQGKDI